MVTKINYQAIEIDHVVEFTNDATYFAAGRENGNNHLRIFLINRKTGNVYTRNSRVDSWEQIYGTDRNNIIARLIGARKNNNIPFYRINGSNKLTTSGSQDS